MGSVRRVSGMGSKGGSKSIGTKRVLNDLIGKKLTLIIILLESYFIIKNMHFKN